MEDRRIRKSKLAIQSAFINLLRHKDLDKITIKDITTLANVNRGTFYLHYEDKYSLLATMEDEYIQVLTSKVDFANLTIKNANVEEFAQQFSEIILKNIINHIEEHMDFYQIILSIDRKS